MTSLGLEPLAHARLVGEARRRGGLRLYGRDQLTTAAVAVGFFGAALALSVAIPPVAVPSAWVLLLIVLCHAATSRVEFELGSGSFVPTQLVLVPMLFLVPPAVVPLLVALGYVVSGLPDLLGGRLHGERTLVRLSYSWHAVGPAVVFGVANPGPPSWSDWPIYGLALGSQFALDLASSMVREGLGVGVAPGILVPVLGRTYLVDALLAPIGLLAAFAATENALGFLPVLSLVALLALLASDRRERIGETIEITDAFETATTAARADRLTGLANRLAWEERIEELGAPRDDAQPVSVILVDLDGLKHANDTRGHAFGDALIQTAAAVVAASIGSRGLVARLGGDELGVLLPGHDEGACAQTLARLDEAIRSHTGIDGYRLSASLGAASSPPEPTLAQAVVRADGRMYARKRHSRLSRIHIEGLDVPRTG